MKVSISGRNLSVAWLVATLWIVACSPPEIEKVNRELWDCKTEDCVMKVFDEHKERFIKSNDRLEMEIDEDFLERVRKRLDKLPLTDGQMEKWGKWLRVPTSLNLLVVPDLSRRIVDTMNNPHQIDNDKVILRYIWEAFGDFAKSEIETEHRLTIDVTDERQVNGRFWTVANNLKFDLFGEKMGRVTKRARDSVRTLYDSRLDSMGKQYKRNIDTMYLLAKEKPIGADYWFYFKYHLSKHIRKTSLDVYYRNMLIIITDGYLEAENSMETGILYYTGDINQRKEVCRRMKEGTMVEDAVKGVIEIRDIDPRFPTLEVLILEVNKRKGRSEWEKDPGAECDYDILRYLWTDWFKRLEIKNNADGEFFVIRSHIVDDNRDILKDRLLKGVK
jgi:hypothetical protein